MNLIRVSLRDHQRYGGPLERTGNQLGRNSPGTTYRVQTRRPERLRLHLCAAADVAGTHQGDEPGDLAEDARFKTPGARYENRAVLDGIVERGPGNTPSMR